MTLKPILDPVLCANTASFSHDLLLSVTDDSSELRPEASQILVGHREEASGFQLPWQ